MKYRAAIVYLLNNTVDSIIDFKRSLELLHKHYLIYHEFIDLIFFHERDFDLNLISEKLNYVSVEVDFKYDRHCIQILDMIPEFFPHPTHSNGPLGYGQKGFNRGYRHMRQFFFSEYFQHRIFDDYDYIMRLDTDSFILAPVEDDLFNQLDRSKSVYGFIKQAIQIDNPLVTKNLWEYTSKRYSIKSKPGTMYYTNFEIVKVKFFRSVEAIAFYDFIHSSCGIHLYRWGDAPLRYLMFDALDCFEKAQPINGLLYQHGGIYDCRNRKNIFEKLYAFRIPIKRRIGDLIKKSIRHLR